MKKALSALTLIAATVVSAIFPAQAQTLPAKPLRIVLPYGTGGATDTVSRQIAIQMTSLLGQSVIMENKPGGGGIPAIQDVLSQPADGSTMLNADASHWAILPILQNVPYDFTRDFAPLGQIFTTPQFYVIPTAVPATTLQEFIALAKAKPGTLNYGTPGFGGIHHLHGETLKSLLGLDIRYVPYKGGGEALEALLRNDIQLTLTALAVTAEHIKAGKLRVLAVATKQRTPLAPNVPTVAELTGLKDFEFAGQLGMVVKNGTPKAVIDRLSAALMKAVMTPELVQRGANTGIEMVATTPDDFGALIRGDKVKYAAAIKTAGVQPAK